MPNTKRTAKNQSKGNAASKGPQTAAGQGQGQRSMGMTKGQRLKIEQSRNILNKILDTTAAV